LLHGWPARPDEVTVGLFPAENRLFTIQGVVGV
jgi:hypothetical protein